MNFGKAIRNFLFGVVLVAATCSAQAAITVFDKTDGFGGSSFQFKYYDFTISVPGSLTATLFDTSTLTPFDSLGMAIFKTGGSSVAAPIMTPGSFDFTVLAANVGSYTALVFGAPTTPLSTYGVLVTEVPAIPEPEIWAMMLIGAGLVGFQLRRKSKAADATRFA